MSVRILLVDDHRLVRAGVRALLEAEPDLEVVGEAGDGLEVVPLVERLQPDIVFLDLMLPGLGGLEVIRQIRQRRLSCRVIVLSMHANEAYALQALSGGASGYVLKDADAGTLIDAVREVMAGRRFLCPPLSAEHLEDYARRTRSESLDLYETLTAREREVLHLAVQGLTNAEIAARLYISPRTVEVHRGRLMQKLGLRSPAELFHFAARRGLTPPDQIP